MTENLKFDLTDDQIEQFKKVCGEMHTMVDLDKLGPDIANQMNKLVDTFANKPMFEIVCSLAIFIAVLEVFGPQPVTNNWVGDSVMEQLNTGVPIYSKLLKFTLMDAMKKMFGDAIGLDEMLEELQKYKAEVEEEQPPFRDPNTTLN